MNKVIIYKYNVTSRYLKVIYDILLKYKNDYILVISYLLFLINY